MDAFPSGQPITVTDNEFIDNLLEGIGVGLGAGGATWNAASVVSGNTFEGPGIFIWGPAQPAIFGGNSFIVNAGDSIQAAIDAASPGDTIVVAAGTYGEHVDVNKDVTIEGTNAGIDGAGARGPETIITGGVKVSAAGATIDGVEISGSYDTHASDGTDLPKAC